MIALPILTACGSGGESKNDPPIPAQNPQDVEAAGETGDPVLLRGKRMFLRCRTCHTVDADGRNGTGPNLHGFLGTQAGSKDGFNFSKAMKSSDIIWTDEALDKWIQKPTGLVPGTSMAFVGLKKPEDRDALIAYLKAVTK